MKQLKRIASFKRRNWPLGLYRVAGESMQPALVDGQLLLGWRWGVPMAGRVVVARQGRPLVKRVAVIGEAGVWLLGDNAPASTDSRQFGHVPADKIEAVIIWPRCSAAA